MKRIQKIYLVIFIILVIGLTIISVYSYLKIPKICLKGIEEKCFKVEIAESGREKAIGLGDRKSLPEDGGMLFVFDEKARPGFWMKDMEFPLDIIWIDEEFRVVGIDENIQPCIEGEECPIYYPELDVKYVLEINSGISERYGFDEGF